MQKILILLGAPGSGKGTQSQFISDKLGIPHISTGNILRCEIAKKSAIGNKVKEYMDEGLLVPDKVILEIVSERVSLQKGGMLDGFPRTTAQAEALDSMLAKRGLSVSHVVYLRLPDGEVIRRLSDRAACSKCNRPYKLSEIPSLIAEPCGNCGGKLEVRSDDTEKAVKTRLEVYKAQTAPLLDYYLMKGLLQEVNGDAPVSEVSKTILTIIEKKGAEEPVSRIK